MGSKFQKSKSVFGFRILEILIRYTNFQTKLTTLNFRAQIWSKWILGSVFSLYLESTPPIYHVCQFSVEMDDFQFFGLNLGKLPNYVQYFSSNIVEGVAESWVEAEMSWVEVDGAGWSWVHGLVIPVY